MSEDEFEFWSSRLWRQHSIHCNTLAAFLNFFPSLSLFMLLFLSSLFLFHHPLTHFPPLLVEFLSLVFQPILFYSDGSLKFHSPNFIPYQKVPPLHSSHQGKHLRCYESLMNWGRTWEQGFGEEWEDEGKKAGRVAATEGWKLEIGR